MSEARLTRRDLLRGRFADRTKAAAPSTARTPFPVHRPPGAVAEARFLAECTRCRACVDACPEDAIVLAPPRLRAAAGTPTIDPAVAPCRMCDGLPCVDACEPGVLTRTLPPRMGTAVIQTFLCLAHQGTTCSVCIEQCPVDGALARVGGKPVVDAAVCTGCGVCQYACPAPRNAVMIRVEPDGARP